MPTYEYECGSCGHRFEEEQRMADRPVEKCPKCGAAVRRVIGGGAGFMVRGGTSPARAESCSLRETGRTCCGRTERCGSPACREDT